MSLSIFLLLLAIMAAGCAGLVTGTNDTGSTQPQLSITNVQAGTVTTASSQIVWTTNVPANSSVDYGTTPSFGSSSPTDSGMVTSHQVTLTGLAAGTTYYYQVNSTDSNGHRGHGGNSFKTLGFSLSGAINPATGGSGSVLTLGGAGSATTTADSSGNYTFSGLANGSYTIIPSHAGYTFTPNSQSMMVNGANVAGVNFTDSAVATAPTITAQPTNQTITAGQTATFAVIAAGTAPLSYQWQKNGANIGGATAVSYTTPLTTTSDSGSTFDVVVSNSAGSVTSAPATLTVNAATIAPTITAQPASQTVTAGQTATFTMVAAGTAPLTYQWRKNNVAISGATSVSYTTPATTSSDSGAQFTVVVSNSAGSVTSNPASLTVTAAAVSPSITTQPVSQTVTAGQPASFSVVAAGTAPLSYQWSKNGAAISGATSSTYTTPASTSSDNGAQFAVIVSNSAGSVTSNPATLTVNAATVSPTITTQPTSSTVTAGQTATFTAVAAGTAPLSYQWQKNGANIAGATSSSYTTPTTTTSDSGSTFDVVVSNSAGSTTSNAATLTVNAAAVAPSITTQPASQTVTAGQTATFTVVATGTAPLSYQWQKNGAGIAGATGASYTTPATTTADSGSTFQVMVTNAAGSTTSNAATLTVNAVAVAPSITTQPASQTVTAGQTATFTVVAAGTAPLSYQWQKNAASITGATGASYTTPATTTADSGSAFQVVVTNAAGTVTSTSATLTVNPAAVAPSITTQPANQTVTAGQTASFGVAASGTAPLTYQWRKNGVAISGATSTSYTTPATTSSDKGAQFTVVISNSAGSVTSNPATLTVNPVTPPTVSISSPVNGATVSGTISVSGSASDAIGLSSVQVQVDSGAFSPASGTTNWTFSLDTTSLSNAGHTITARATNTSGLTASSSVSVTVSNGTGGGTIINVLNFGAKGDGSTNDTSAINSAIAALVPGDTLLFPCTATSTYLVSSQLTLNLSSITVDGSSCSVIHNTSSGIVFSVGGSGNGNPNYGSAVALSATANELATSFSTVSSLGVSAGDYVRLQQGGQDSSTGSGDTACDTSGCRAELVKVASVSGNSVTVTTALHDTFNPSVNAATAQRVLGPLTGITIKNIIFDGNGSNVYGLVVAGVADSTITGVTARNVQGAALLNRGDFNVSWSNITVTGAGSAQCGAAAWFENQGNLSIDGMSVSNENPGATGSGCLANGAFGFEVVSSANNTIANLTVNAAGAYGRPFKTIASRWNTFNSVTVENGVQSYNGISLEYYSSHNTYNNCVVLNNGAGTGTGTGNAGIITFGNFNQYNSFNNCTVSGNGNVQFYISGYDALSLAADSHNTISGGTFTGENTVEAAILIEGDGTYITGATIRGPGAQGIYLDSQASNACVNNNTFVGGTSLGSAISANGSNDMGLGNLLNLLGSNLPSGTCAPPLP